MVGCRLPLATKCPHGQAVKTSPSHGGIWGSIPHGGTKKTSPLGLVFFIRCSQRHVINACVVCNCNRCVSPMAYCTLCVRNFVARTLKIKQKISGTDGLLRCVDKEWCHLKTCRCRVDTDCLRRLSSSAHTRLRGLTLPVWTRRSFSDSEVHYDTTMVQDVLASI